MRVDTVWQDKMTQASGVAEILKDSGETEVDVFMRLRRNRHTRHVDGNKAGERDYRVGKRTPRRKNVWSLGSTLPASLAAGLDRRACMLGDLQVPRDANEHGVASNA
ncbi:hypothetical protein E4U55_006297 [Claviceps digitariae]|nr:hypothetical protein E4U55_006297 [Claviceps digitariae]